jgi:phosphate-selective porin OprO/OprP
MLIPCGRFNRLMLQAFLFAALAVLGETARAQDPGTTPSTVDLSRRVQELEHTVLELKAGQAQPTLRNVQGSGSLAPDANEMVPPAEGQTDGRAPSDSPIRDSSPSSQGGGFNLERPRVGEDPGRSPSTGLPRGQVAGWNNGFYVQSPDQRFIFRVTGQVQADFHAYLDYNDKTDIDAFLVRRARFGLEARLYDYYEFLLLPDYGLGKSVLEDAYLNIHYWDAFQFEAGKFKQPFSYEQLIQDRYVPTVERSLIDPFVPARDVGVLVHGNNLFGNVLDYGMSISNGVINGDTDLNNSKDFNGRIVLHPFGWTEEGSPLRFLEVGASGSLGQQNQPIQPATVSTPLGVRWFVFNSTVQAFGTRSRWSPEVSYFFGPIGFAAQYFHMNQKALPSTTGVTANSTVDFSVDGYYILASILLTGETRTGYSQAISPVEPFDARHPLLHPGAWELVARVSRAHFDNNVFFPGPFQLADPTKNASAATEMTLGFNWYFNRLVRMQFNWEHSWFDTPVQLGPSVSNKLDHQDAVGLRFQVIF